MRYFLFFVFMVFPCFAQTSVVDTVLPDGTIQRVTTNTTTQIISQDRYQRMIQQTQTSANNQTAQATTMQGTLSKVQSISAMPANSVTPVLAGPSSD